VVRCAQPLPQVLLRVEDLQAGSLRPDFFLSHRDPRRQQRHSATSSQADEGSAAVAVLHRRADQVARPRHQVAPVYRIAAFQVFCRVPAAKYFPDHHQEPDSPLRFALGPGRVLAVAKHGMTKLAVSRPVCLGARRGPMASLTNHRALLQAPRSLRVLAACQESVCLAQMA